MYILYATEGEVDSWLTKALRESGHGVATARSLPEALVKVVAGPMDAVIVDAVANPGDWISRLAAAQPNAGRILLMPAPESGGIADFLDLGADVCLRRPFLFTELAARLDALRPHGHPGARGSGISLLEEQRAVRVDGIDVSLTPHEFLLVSHLLRSPGQPLPAEQLCRYLWDDAEGAHAENLKVLIHRLRTKLKRHTGKAVIGSRRRSGYYISP